MPNQLRAHSALLIATLSSAGACHKHIDVVHITTPDDRDAGGVLDGGDSGTAADGGKGGAANAAGGASGAGGVGNAGNGGDVGGDDVDAGNIRDCTVSADLAEWSETALFSDEAGFSVTPATTGFGMAYRAMGCGALGGLGTLPVAALGAYKKPQVLFGDCSGSILDVSLLHVSDGYRAVWVDNSTGSAELQSILLADSLAVPASPTRTRLTDNALRELRPTQANFGSVAYLGWITVADDGTRQIDLQRFEDGAAPKTLAGFADGYLPTSLAMGQLGRDRGALAFVDEQGHPGVWLVPIDDTGQPSAAVQISAEIGAGNTADLATRTEDGGAIVYSLDLEQSNHEVRVRRLDPQGGFLGDEIKVIGSPLQGRDASIARLGDGYVVAYRQLPTGDATQGEIRLAFITKEGNPQRDGFGRLLTTPVTTAAPGGGRVTVRVSVEGQLLVGFVDSDDQGPKFRLLRRRLDCQL